jgi:predicted DNA-binding antitoxin AbrB/MazE fold protein
MSTCVIKPASHTTTAGIENMALEVEATYEGGVLKPTQPLPLREHQRVSITVREETSQARISYGLIPWTGDPEVLRAIAEDPESRVLEYP